MLYVISQYLFYQVIGTHDEHDLSNKQDFGFTW